MANVLDHICSTNNNNNNNNMTHNGSDKATDKAISITDIVKIPKKTIKFFDFMKN